eukprot:jgi/Ulvmu1/4664/UM002_0395.1
MMSFLIGGHRGGGENMFSLAAFRAGRAPCNGIRENSLKSFTHAAASGADFVELDVQVTSDGVPVIFHDDYVVHGSLVAPKRTLISEMTLAQFKSLGQLLRRSKCVETQELQPHDNIWLCEQEDSMPELVDVLQQLPQTVGVNVEVKMATSGALAETPRKEVDRVVEPIVSVLEQCAGDRQLYVSSFDPDVMKALAVHRREGKLAALSSLTMWFLTAGGGEKHADVRRMSVAAAVAFADKGGIDGIVVETEAARQQRDDVNAALEMLKVMTYGIGNNDMEWVKEQQKLGFQGIITDDVPSAVQTIKAYGQGLIAPVSAV